jgi:hypothetical protein
MPTSTKVRGDRGLPPDREPIATIVLVSGLKALAAVTTKAANRRMTVHVSGPKALAAVTTKAANRLETVHVSVLKALACVPVKATNRLETVHASDPRALAVVRMTLAAAPKQAEVAENARNRHEIIVVQMRFPNRLASPRRLLGARSLRAKISCSQTGWTWTSPHRLSRPAVRAANRQANAPAANARRFARKENLRVLVDPMRPGTAAAVRTSDARRKRGGRS